MYRLCSVYFLSVNERGAFLNWKKKETNCSPLWRILENCSAFYHLFERIYCSCKMSLLLTVALLTLCSHFSAPRGETWPCCYVAKEGWCCPWRSSSSTASDPTVFSRGTCLFGTLSVRTVSLSSLGASIKSDVFLLTDVYLMSPSSGSGCESRRSNCMQQSMTDMFNLDHVSSVFLWPYLIYCQYYK